MKQKMVIILGIVFLVLSIVGCNVSSNNSIPQVGDEPIIDGNVRITNLQWFFYERIWHYPVTDILLSDNIDEWDNTEVLVISNNCLYTYEYTNKTFVVNQAIPLKKLTDSLLEMQGFWITNNTDPEIQVEIFFKGFIRYTFDLKDNTNFLYINQFIQNEIYNVYSNGVCIASNMGYTSSLVDQTNALFRQWVFINITNL